MAKLSITDIRLKGQRKFAYFGRALMALHPIEKPGEGTFSVDKAWRMYYDPEFLAKLKLEEGVTVVIHELLHLLEQHHRRFRAKIGRDMVTPDEALRWNVAADCAINGMLREFGLPFPSWLKVCFAEQWKMPANLTAEEYYDLLPEQPLGKQAQPQLIGGGSCGDGQKKPWEDGQGDSQDGEGDGDGQGKKDGQGNGPGGLGELEQELMRRVILQGLEKHAKGRGTLPAGLARLVKDALAKPKVDWRRELKARVHKEVNYVLGQGDFSYRRLRRREMPGGVMLPGMIKPLINAAALLDTSGSMGNDDLQRGLSEFDGIAKALGVPFWVLCGDTEVSWAKKVTSSREVKPVGGGGTDMREMIAAATKLRPKPDIIVCVTDGETPWPSSPTKQRVIVVLTRSGSAGDVPKWMSVVRID